MKPRASISPAHSRRWRFSSPVFPGEALTVRIWRTGDGEAVFRTEGGDGRTVIDSGLARFDV